MEYLEQHLCQTKRQAEEMRELCAIVFQNEHGRRLLAKLVNARHPMTPRFDLTKGATDTHKAAFVDGQCDVIGLLWRYGSDSKALPEPTNEQ